MSPEDVPAELVEKAKPYVSGTIQTQNEWGDVLVRRIIAAVLPEIQARALRDAKAWIKASSDLSTLDGDWARAWNLSTSHALAVLDDRAVRLTATTEEQT